MLGEGGQGEVYLVNDGVNYFAFKYYFDIPSSDFKYNLRNNILKGAPSNTFLWPKKYIEFDDDSCGYLIENIIDNKLMFEVISQQTDFDDNEDSYSLSVIVTFFDKKLLFVGDKYEFSYLTNNIEPVVYYKASNSYSFDDSYKSFLKKISSGNDALYTVIGTSLNYINSNASIFGSEKYCGTLLAGLRKESEKPYIYPVSYINSNKEHIKINGTICFELKCEFDNQKYLVTPSMRQEYNSNVILLEDSDYYKNVKR